MNTILASPWIHKLLTIAILAIAMFSCRDDDDPPVPEVMSLNPASGRPGELVSIVGKNFSPVFSDNKVTFNGKEALVANASPAQLNVMVPADVETGPVVVAVDGRTATQQPIFTVQAPPSVLTSISPSSGGYNTVVTITGSNFFPTPASNSVTFNGVPATVTSATTTNLTVKVPSRVGSGNIVVNGVAGGTIFKYVPEVFIAGHVSDASGRSRATYWRNGVPTTIGLPGHHTYANDIVVVNDEVHVAGYRHIITFGVARWWKNGTEMPLGDDTRITNADAISASGNDVYISGYEWPSPGKSTARYWKNGNPVPITDGTSNAFAYGVAVNGPDIYVAGNSIHPNGNAVATYWKNGTPHYLTTGISHVYDIFVLGSDVYTTGSIRNTGPGVGFASYWKNDTAVLLSPGLTGADGKDIVVVGNDVYVAGLEDNAKNIPVAKYWKNGVPVVLSDGAYTAVANGIDVIGEDVYVAGFEENAAGIAVAKYWKNGVPTPITDGGYYAIATALVLR